MNYNFIERNKYTVSFIALLSASLFTLCYLEGPNRNQERKIIEPTNAVPSNGVPKYREHILPKPDEIRQFRAPVRERKDEGLPVSLATYSPAVLERKV